MPWILSLLTAALGAQERPLDPAMAQIGAAYAAKVAASAVFVSGRTIASVREEEFAPVTTLDRMMRPLLRFEVDREGRAVTASIGLARATAIATDGLGCTLVLGDVTAAALRQRGIPAAPPAIDPDTLDWPRGERLPPLPSDAAIDLDALQAALDAAFAEPEQGPPRCTRAVVVVHQGHIVAERYAAGYDRDTPLPGWSMTKTLVDALVGIRVGQGKLDLDQPMRVEEWPADDPRRRLRLPALLTMSSGLAWNESYTDPGSDVLRMLFTTPDHAAVMADKPQQSEAGVEWLYSSGSTNLICRELRATFETDADYWAFPRQALFAPLGMHRALIETDPSGTWVGSSYGFATARDWARIGMLYRDDGVFAGRRILPAGWVASSTRAVAASNGRYGSQIWLNVDPDGDGPRQRPAPDYPADMLRLDGHEGQHVFVLPGADLVITRLGCSKGGNHGAFELLTAALAALQR